MLTFYLDDYNRISVRENEKLLNNSLKVFCNQQEVAFELIDEGDYLTLKLALDYQDQAQLNVVLGNENYEVVPRFIVQTKRFEMAYQIDISVLGSFVNNGQTIFRLWSPLSKRASVVIDGQISDMNYLGGGLYELIVNNNLEGQLYHYQVLREKEYSFSDPFAYFEKDNESYVLDAKKLVYPKVPLQVSNDPIIYEINVRDFSSGNNLPFTNPKKLLALVEDKLELNGQKIGLAYLKELGITHVQLMPIFSYDYDHKEYNWGYNPLNFNCLHQDYLVSKEPYEALSELAKVVNKFHEAKIAVNLDIVFNHVYKTYRNNLGLMLPYYFFRYQDEKLGNASFCGNELRSEAPFLRAYFKLLIRRLIELYDIDGLRFDLMGILDYQTINAINDEAKKIKANFMVYGEGWNMGEILPEKQRASLDNATKLKDIAFFNDTFRNTIRGKDINDTKCFLFGGGLFKEEAKKVLRGEHETLNYRQSLNYVECHDNFTLFDKAIKINPAYCKELSKLALALVMIARGHPFIHSGQEFLRTKQGVDNSYNLGDEFNALDWYRKNDNLEVVNYLQELIKLRLNHEEFSKDKVVISFGDYYECLIYRLDALNIFINPCLFDHIYNSDDTYEVIYDDHGFVNYETKAFKIKAFSVVFAYKKTN